MQKDKSFHGCLSVYRKGVLFQQYITTLPIMSWGGGGGYPLVQGPGCVGDPMVLSRGWGGGAGTPGPVWFYLGSGGPTRQDYRVPLPPDRLHRGRYASCGHAGGLSCMYNIQSDNYIQLKKIYVPHQVMIKRNILPSFSKPHHCTVAL